MSLLRGHKQNTRWLGSGLCNRNVPFHWAREVPEISNRNFCWMESAPDSSLRILARVISCEFTREAVSEISTSTVSLNKMSFKKFHPFKDFQSVQIQRSSRNIFTAHYACRMPNWIWHQSRKQLIDGFIFQIINSLIESWGGTLDLPWLQYPIHFAWHRVLPTGIISLILR